MPFTFQYLFSFSISGCCLKTLSIAYNIFPVPLQESALNLDNHSRFVSIMEFDFWDFSLCFRSEGVKAFCLFLDQLVQSCGTLPDSSSFPARTPELLCMLNITFSTSILAIWNLLYDCCEHNHLEVENLGSGTT